MSLSSFWRSFDRKHVPGRAPLSRWTSRLSGLRTSGRSFVLAHGPNESQHLFALTLLVGVVCGLVAVAFHLAIKAAEHLLIERAMHADGNLWMVWTILTPALGGLAAGAALTWLVPGARGSGVPQVKQAFAVEGGRVRLRDALGKFVIGALQIGSGASLGREGPTVQICAGAASFLGRVTSLPPRHMRRLTPVGVAAGIAAAFNAPIAAVTFTIEEIVGTLDQAVLSGVVVAAALAAVIERGILGVHPVLQVEQAYGLDHASSLPLFALLGVAAALVSVVFTDGLLGVRGWFRRLRRLPSWTHPAVGGLVTGGLAVVMLEVFATTGVTGGGYETLGHALAGKLGLRVLLALCVVKLVATVCSYSSGGAGGIFAPSLFVGAMLGGAMGHLDVRLLDHESRQVGAFALVGMGAVFAGVIRAPITSVLIIFEMTGGYGLVLPLMIANMTAYILARRLRPEPIYEALLAQDGIVLPDAAHPAHAIERLRVAQAMTADPVRAHLGQSIPEVLAMVASRDFACLPVVDRPGNVVGTIAVSELRAADPAGSLATLLRPARTVRGDMALLRAVVRMNDLGVRQLLVVDSDADLRLIGVLAMSDIVRTHARVAAKSAGAELTPLPMALPEVRAASLMIPADLISRQTLVAELLTRLDDGPRAFLIDEGASGAGVILPEQLREFADGHDLARMLRASDLAQAATGVEASTDLTTLARLMRESQAAMMVVLDEHRVPVGVVTRAAVSLAFLEWYGARPPARSTPHRSLSQPGVSP